MHVMLLMKIFFKCKPRWTLTLHSKSKLNLSDIISHVLKNDL